ncbi:MAG: SDR family NAD(P)-dependent oxidoreductase [Eubacteriales bacterium]|nr:SDR family NAD(P)-dependent oxidoreductase [Eubacteriales bacterium]
MKYIAIITGASSGMGREMAIQLAKLSKVELEFWLIARRKNRIEELHDKITQLGHQAVCIEADLLYDDIFSELESRLDKNRHRVLYLVNASGFGKIGKFEQLSMEEQTDMLELNVVALMKLCRLVIPYMVKNHGKIINFASAAAFVPQPEFTVYAASKSFVLSFSRALNEELTDKGITVTAICPGPVKTEFFDIAEEKSQAKLYKKMLMANPKRVVKKAIRDAFTGKDISVYGLSMKLLYVFSGILPTEFVFSVIRKINHTGKQ